MNKNWRFLKNSAAAQLAVAAGYVVKPFVKTNGFSTGCGCSMCGMHTWTTSGFLVNATQQQLQSLGLMSSSAQSNAIFYFSQNRNKKYGYSQPI